MEYNPWILLAESAPIGVKAPGAPIGVTMTTCSLCALRPWAGALVVWRIYF